MPIYAYRCANCGHEKDVLQKLSDAPLTQCPACGKDAFSKQVTAAGFQLKGSGWYVTDFRGGNSGSNKAADGGTPGTTAAKPDDASASSGNAAGSNASESATSTTASSSDASKPAAGPSASSSAV